MITSANFPDMRKSEILYPFQWNSLIAEAIAGWTAEGFGFSGPNAATIEQLEINATGTVGIQLATTDQDLTGLWKIPFDVNPRYPIGLSFLWTTPNATAASPCRASFTINGGLFIEGSTLAAVSTAWDGSPKASNYPVTDGTDWLLTQKSPRIFFNINALKVSDIENGAFLIWDLGISAVAAMTNVIVLAANFDYVPTKCIGNGAETDLPITSSGL